MLNSSFNITIDTTTTASSSGSDPATGEEDEGITESLRSQRSAADSEEYSDHHSVYSWTNVISPDDDIRPSDSASRPPKRPRSRPGPRPPPSEPMDNMDERPGYAAQGSAPYHSHQYYGYPSPYLYQTYVQHGVPPSHPLTTPAPQPGFLSSPYAAPLGYIPPAYEFIPATSTPPAEFNPPAPPRLPTSAPPLGVVPPPSASPPEIILLTPAPPSLRVFHRCGTADSEPKKGTILREEVDVIKSILKEQEGVLSDFKAVIEKRHNKASLTAEIIDRMLRRIERRIENFEQHQIQADNARSLVVQTL